MQNLNFAFFFLEKSHRHGNYTARGQKINWVFCSKQQKRNVETEKNFSKIRLRIGFFWKCRFCVSNSPPPK